MMRSFDKHTGSGCPLAAKTVIIKGAGEKASAVAHRLHQCGLQHIAMTELPAPLAERRGVCFCEAVIEGGKEVSGVRAQRSEPSVKMVTEIWKERNIPVVVDDEDKLLGMLKPDIFIDAIMAKRNTGTTMDKAPMVIALGPGFIAGRDAHLVVETNPNSHFLGRVISDGPSESDTAVPSSILGMRQKRIIRSPGRGVLHSRREVGDVVGENEVIGTVNGSPLLAPLEGVIWGLVRDGVTVKAGQKIGDIDPRGKRELCFEIAAQARSIAGGVLEAVIRGLSTKNG